MCCFSALTPLSWIGRIFVRPVRVSATNIFARMIEPGVQGLAYSMNLVAKEEVAMILPIPVAPGSGEDALEFVNLEKHAQMFEELHMCFEMPQRKGGIRLFAARGQRQLKVHTVGSFVASYVPTKDDFGRLDPRFRMPAGTWDQLPAYGDYGFAVFQLAKGKSTVHPMAFRFPTRDREKLYFPTVHIHDGRVHPRAKFDHALYYQTREEFPQPGERRPVFETTRNASDDPWAFMSPMKDYEGLADRERPLARRIIRGRHANADTWISLS